MANIQLSVRPEIATTVLVDIHQSIEEIEESGCRNAYNKRLRHTLTIRNHCFSVKQRFKLVYNTDTSLSLLCSAQDQNFAACGGAATAEQVSFPVAQMYWRGQGKTLTKLLCWGPNKEDPDFNLQIEISCEAFSSGSPPQELQRLNDTVSLVSHGTLLEEQNGR
jgi:hypothetical protein